MLYLTKSFLPCLLFAFVGLLPLSTVAQQKVALTFAVMTYTHIGKPGNAKGLEAIVNNINQNAGSKTTSYRK